jgi:hypothetical protein
MFESTRDAAVTAMEQLFVALRDATVDECAVVHPSVTLRNGAASDCAQIASATAPVPGFAPAPSAFPPIFEIAANHSNVINLLVRTFCIMSFE